MRWIRSLSRPRRQTLSRASSLSWQRDRQCRRRGIHLYVAKRLNDRSLSSTTPMGDADPAATGPACCSALSWASYKLLPASLRCHPPRHQVPAELPTASPRLHLRELRPTLPRSQSLGDRRQRPRQLPRLSHPSGPMKIVKAHLKWCPSFSVAYGGQRSTTPARRRSPGMAITRLQIRYGALQLHQHRQLRSSRSVDFHGLDGIPQALRGTANVDFAIFPRGGWLRSTPSAPLVPPQHDERIHGADHRARTTLRRRASCPGRRSSCHNCCQAMVRMPEPLSAPA